jgi:uncharacterized protein YkwD
MGVRMRIAFARLLLPLALATVGTVAFVTLCGGEDRASAAAEPGCGPIEQAPQAATLQELQIPLLCLVNRARERRKIAPLRFNDELCRAATGHSSEMVEHGYFSHDGSHGSSLTARVQKAGYLARAAAYAIAENIGGGPGRRYGSPIAVFRMWMHSPGHRANILNPRFREFGIGAARGFPFGGGLRAATYTLDLGARS